MNCLSLKTARCASVLLAFLLSCALQRTSGSGGTETVNTYAVLSDGTPASGAIVRVVDAQGWLDSVRKGASVVIESATADSRGRVALHPREFGNAVNLQADHMSQGAFSPLVNFATLAGDTLRLSPYASYSGRFDSGAKSLSYMLLSGSAYSTQINSQGSFSFDKVAAGAFSVLGVGTAQGASGLATSGAVSLSAGSSVLDTGLNASYARLLIDNFESGIGQTALGLYFPNTSSWYGVCESSNLSWNWNTGAWVENTFTSLGNPATCHTFISLGSAPGPFSGHSMEFSVKFDSTCTTPYAAAGTSFKVFNGAGVDFSSLTGFSLKIRGNGILWIRLETRNLDSASNQVSDYTYQATLTNAWQSLTVPVDSLQILPAGPSVAQYPWSQESHNVIDLEFQFPLPANSMSDTLHLDVDDIYLNGVGISNVKP